MDIGKILNYLAVLIYLVLLVIWVVIAVLVWSTVKRRRDQVGLEHTSRRLLRMGLLVSIALAVDCGYWMFETAGRLNVVVAQPQSFLENPVANIIEKLFLVAAAGAFLSTFLTISTLTSAEMDRRYFSMFAEWASDGISMLDPNGCIRYWNLRAEEMFGWKRQDVRGKDIRELMVPPDHREEATAVLDYVRSQRTAKSLERTERTTASHKTLIVAIDTAPIISEANDFVGYFSIIRPASQRDPFANHPYFHIQGLPARKPGKVFVAMPYTIHKEGLDVWKQILLPVAGDLNLNIVRADRRPAENTVMDKVFQDIASSEFVVADLTGNNPNVYYEVGIAHTIGIPILLLLLIHEPIPFNLVQRQVIYCDPHDLDQACKDVKEAILQRRGGEIDSPQVASR